jgi:hypothetical protein
MGTRWQLLSLAAVALVCVGLAQTQPGHAVLVDAGLYETPATYTELAFSDPGALPNALKKPSESLIVSFRIHNVSTDERSYQWSIALVHGTDSQVKASGDAPTAAQRGTTVTRSVAASCASGRLEVVVRLASPVESISFWLTCPTAAGKKSATQ